MIRRKSSAKFLHWNTLLLSKAALYFNTTKVVADVFIFNRKWFLSPRWHRLYKAWPVLPIGSRSHYYPHLFERSASFFLLKDQNRYSSDLLSFFHTIDASAWLYASIQCCCLFAVVVNCVVRPGCVGADGWKVRLALHWFKVASNGYLVIADSMLSLSLFVWPGGITEPMVTKYMLVANLSVAQDALSVRLRASVLQLLSLLS